MSGPKVVRVVTREEIIAICQGHLSRLEEVSQAWGNSASRHGAATEAELTAMNQRKAALHALLTNDKFTELQKDVPAEIAFLRADMSEREDRAVRAATKAGEIRRRLSDSASTLRNALSKVKSTDTDALDAELQAVMSGKHTNENAEAILSRALTSLASAKDDNEATISDQQRAIANALGIGLETSTYSNWLSQQSSGTNRDSRIGRIDHYIAELEIMEGADVAAPFAQRASDLSGERDVNRRSLLMDTLVVELAAAATMRRTREKLLADLGELRAELRRFDTESVKSIVSEIDLSIERRNLGSGVELLQQARVSLASELKRMASEARRAAVLQGLAGLGYEVREGMATAWAKDGKLVLRKVATPGYGVELGSATGAERMQVRVVSFTRTQDATRDRDMETIWCSEFTRLQDLIKKAGGGLVIEKAHPVGAVPVKIIEEMVGEHIPIDVAVPKSRTQS